MTDACDHDGHTPHQSGSLGIPQIGQFDPVAFERAVNDMLVACGVAPDSVHTGRTAQRVRELWQKRLLGALSSLLMLSRWHDRQLLELNPGLGLERP